MKKIFAILILVGLFFSILHTGCVRTKYVDPDAADRAERRQIRKEKREENQKIREEKLKEKQKDSLRDKMKDPFD